LQILSIVLPLSVKRIPFISTKRQIIVENVKRELEQDSRSMYEERKAWFAKSLGVDDESKDVLTILSRFSDSLEGRYVVDFRSERKSRSYRQR
jgi:hypothetical protein